MKARLNKVDQEEITGDEYVYPSFPNSGYTTPGITLRQHFASLAMQGLLAQANFLDVDSIVETSFKIADKIIFKLNK